MSALEVYDPAADIAARHPRWRVIERRLPDDIDGYAEASTRTVFIDARLRPAARRSTLTHELIHVDLGHDGPQPAAVEAAVEVLAADRLLRPAAAIAAQHELRHLRALADDLGVDTGTVLAWQRARMLAGEL